MRKSAINVFLITLALGLVLIQTGKAADPLVPSSVGGFSLHSSIEDYPAGSQANYLKEVIYTDFDGFRKGFITYGTCRNPGKILRIKLKYEERSYDFFQDLLKRYKKKFGAKPKYDGDQFGNVKSWKWSFTDAGGQRVTLELQHNLKDAEESKGNMVKLGLPDLMNEERLCFNERQESGKSKKAETQPRDGKPDWQILIPN